jgi:dihydrofolate reductase
MGKVVSSASMSLDGFIANPDNSVGSLFDWYNSGDVEVGTAVEGFSFTLTPQSAAYWRSWTADLGALVVGRELFDVTDGWGGSHPLGVPVVVLTHEPPTDWHYPGAENFSFVTEGIEAAVARAHQVAGGKDVGVAAGTIARQCLEAGLLDEVAVDLVPVVMGQGRPYFGELSDDLPYLLGDPTTLIQGERVTHLVFPVKKG